MKKYFLTLCLIILPLLSYAENFSGWITQPVYPVDGALFCSYFISPTTGWIGGEKGIIIRTDDGGDTWEMQDSGTMESIRGIYFVNDKKGWAVDVDGQILSSTDGGRKWAIQNKTNLSPRNVQFFSEKEWLIGGLGIHRTTDSGKTWVPLKFSATTPSEPGILSMHFINPQIGWFLLSDSVSIYGTTDGGKTWQKSDLPIPNKPDLGLEGNFGGIYFLSPKTGWVVRGTKLVYKTTDGGKKWEIVNILDAHSYMSDVIFFDDNHGCIENYYDVYCTEDGGKTFKHKIKGSSDTHSGFEFNKFRLGDKQMGWVVGSGASIAKTEDSGKTWQIKTIDNSLSFPTFIDSRNGYYFPENRIEGTKDGGKTRKTLHAVSFDRMQDTKILRPLEPGLFFQNENIGWVGWVHIKHTKKEVPRSLILNTRDGGATWTVQYDEQGEKINDIFFITPTKGWVVGGNGLVLHTQDAGKTWSHQKINIKKYLLLWKVFFINEKKGWILGEQKDDADSPSGEQSIIFQTIDGGSTWGVLSKIRGNLLEKIIYLNEKNMWISGIILGSDSSGDTVNLLHSQDGGKTWKSTHFNEINKGTHFFKDEKKGVLLGDKGLMYITNDGGKTWGRKRQNLSKEPWNINSVFSDK